MSRAAVFGLLALVLACTPPDPALSDPDDFPDAIRTGETITVQFRRDHLGAAADLPVSPTTNSINGAATSVTGRLHSISPEWVVVDSNGRRHWIARESVLLLSAKMDD